MADKSGRVVFIGNIPYGLTEEQIVQLCSTVGQVISFRLVYDPDTGRPKGFGFAEFADSDAAESAVRNLDKHQVQGRELRVAFSHDANKSGGGGGGGGGGSDGAGSRPGAGPPSAGLPTSATAAAAAAISAAGASTGNPGIAAAAAGGGIGLLPPGADLAPGLTATDSISKTLHTLPAPQLLDILSQMKALVVGDPARATELLRQAPQLSYAIFQALLLMGLVDAGLIARVVEQAAGAAAPQSAPPPQAAPQQPQPQPQAAAGGVPPNQQELLRQVLSMPQSEIDRLPPAERAQVMGLKQQFGGMV